LRLGLYGYNDLDNLDHSYIMIGYLDIDIKNTVYNNLRTPVNSVCVITCVHATPAVTAGGKRRDTEDTRGADPSETQLMMTWSRR
jgi:hypothetical protein